MIHLQNLSRTSPDPDPSFLFNREYVRIWLVTVTDFSKDHLN